MALLSGAHGKIFIKHMTHDFEGHGLVIAILKIGFDLFFLVALIPVGWRVLIRQNHLSRLFSPIS